MRIRAAAESDIAVLRDVERAAGRCFQAIGMAEIADDEPPSAEILRTFIAAGSAWVAVDGWPADTPPVAYLVADRVDSAFHIEQVSVHPEAARRGIGRALIEHLAAYAAGQGGAGPGIAALTLTTFADVPWNATYYERCGFRRLADAELSPGLVAIRRREAELGLDRWPRVCMRRDLP